MSREGSAGNVIAAICSFIIPGLGQLVQGRLLAAGMHFVAAVIIGVITFGWLSILVSIYSCYSAATYDPYDV